MLEINNLSLLAGSKILLNDNLNLIVQRGECIALIGNNGTGKSTLLKTIAGHLPISAGKIRIGNDDLKETSVKEWSKNVIYIHARSHFNLSTSVEEYLQSARLGYSNRLGLLKKNDFNAIKKAIEQTGIENLLQSNFDLLSDGEKQLVTITRALVFESKIILLDEPTSHLDVNNKKRMTEMLYHIAKQTGRIIIYSTHDYLTVPDSIQRVWCIDENKILKDGNFREIFA